MIDEVGALADAAARAQAPEDHHAARMSRRSSPRSRASRPRACRADDKRDAAQPRARPEGGGVRPGQGDRGAVVGDQAGPRRPARCRRSRSATTCSRGPTGVGKTEVAEQLRQDPGHRADPLRHVGIHGAPRVSRLIGAPPGYVGFDQGGLLTDAIDQHPHCVLLLDEIEKAHPDLFNILLQVMDHGKLTDHNGKTVDFRNVDPDHDHQCRRVRHGASRRSASAARSARARTRTRSSGCSRRNSATGWMRSSPFADLTPEIVGRVVDKFVLQLEAQLADRNVHIELIDGARRMAGRDGLRQAVRRAAAGPRDPGAHQAAAGRGTAVRQAGQGRRGEGRR